MADWKEVASKLAEIGLPLLGAALPIPGGMAIGAALASAISSKSTKPEDILATIAGNAENLQKAKEFEATHQTALLQLQMNYEIEMRKADSGDIENVNLTMQEEAKSDHWPTYAWRPFNGFLFGIMVFCTYFILPILHIPVPSIPETVWMGWGAILGVASWFRGKAQADPTIKTDNRG